MSVGPNSFVDRRSAINKFGPPPKYFSNEFLTQDFAKLPVAKDDVLFGFDFPECGGLICTD